MRIQDNDHFSTRAQHEEHDPRSRHWLKLPLGWLEDNWRADQSKRSIISAKILSQAAAAFLINWRCIDWMMRTALDDYYFGLRRQFLDAFSSAAISLAPHLLPI